jgi:hypothetical protein
MADNEFVGSALYAQWISTTPAGTVTLNTEFRNFNYSPSLSFIDATAGADTATRRISHLKDGQVTVTHLMQSDLGTVQMAALAEGAIGTLTWAEAGTASTKPKHVMACICMGTRTSVPYNDVVTLDTTFQQNGARTDSAWA